MTTRERSIAQEQFNQTGGLLLATDAASEGLNLQHACRMVIHFELPWSPARLEQRTGRVDRIGQTRVVHNILLVASDTAERLVLAPLVRRAARASHFIPSEAHLLERLSESRVASAILDGTSLDVGATSLDAVTFLPQAELRLVAQKEAARVADVRTWKHASTHECSPSGIPAVAIKSRRGLLQGGVTRIYKFTVSAEDGAVVHTEFVAIHDHREIRRADTPSDVRHAVRALNLYGSDDQLLELFHDRIADVSGSCAQLGAALSEREMVVSAPAISSAQQLVQRGLFDRRSDCASQNRARIDAAIVEEATDRFRSYRSWRRTFPSLKLHAVLLVSDSARS
jgi:Superfamily II DNA/RNA helicases, SNF2 family